MSILGFFLEESLFDMGLFQSDKVLTSRQVQLQFQKAVKERAKKNTILIECFWLLDESETESFLKIDCTISRNKPHCSGKKTELFTEKPAIIPGKTLNYSGKNLDSSMKKTGYSSNNFGFSNKKPDYSKNKNLKNNNIYKRAMTHKEKQELIQEFGSEITEEYIRRTSEYHCCNPKTIRKWIMEDQKNINAVGIHLTFFHSAAMPKRRWTLWKSIC